MTPLIRLLSRHMSPRLVMIVTVLVYAGVLVTLFLALGYTPKELLYVDVGRGR